MKASTRQSVAGALLAAVVLASTSATAGQGQTAQDRQRITALEEAQKAILQELKEIKALLQQQRPAPVPQQAQQPPAPLVDTLAVADAATRGNAAAKLTIIEFSDFECPFCARYVRDTYKQIQKEYVDTGKVRYVFRHFPLAQIHPNATRAAEASECARVQGKFWEYHDRLFANPRALAIADLNRYGTELGLNMPAFEQCLAGQTAAKVRKDLSEAAQAGMAGTPTFFIGTSTPDGKVKVLKKMVGALPYDAFKAAFDELLATAK